MKSNIFSKQKEETFSEPYEQEVNKKENLDKILAFVPDVLKTYLRSYVSTGGYYF